MNKDTKSKIFGEYIGCQVINDIGEISILTYSNFESCIIGNWKLVLDSPYNIPQELINIITETERYNRRIDAIQNSSVIKKISNESRNHPNDNNSFMISYMRFDDNNPTKRDGFAEGISDWFNIKYSLSKSLIKSNGFDLGSFWYQNSQGKELNLIDSEYAIQREYEIISNFKDFEDFITKNIKNLKIISNGWSDKNSAINNLLIINHKKLSLDDYNHKKYFDFIDNLNIEL